MTVLLSGRPGGTTHREIELLASLPAELRLIGGLAVMVRVGTPHRATVDLDTVARNLESHHAALARLALTATGGGQYTFDGNLDLDVIDVAPVPAVELAEQLSVSGEPLSDLELNLVAHTWAHDTATPLDVTAVDDLTGEVLAVAKDRLVATTAGIIAMKASTVPLRASSRAEKRASDLYDLGRLLIAGHMIRTNVETMPPVMRDPVIAHLVAWFVDDSGRDRTYREVRRFDEPRLDLDAVSDAVEDLVASL
jgi:hypothetical protein